MDESASPSGGRQESTRLATATAVVGVVNSEDADTT